MINFYTAFKTNLSIPIRVEFSCTNKFNEIEPIHTSRDIRISTGYSKHNFPNKLSYMQIVYCMDGTSFHITEKEKYQINGGDCLIMGRQLVRWGDTDNLTPHSVYTISIDHEFCKKLGVDDTITALTNPDDTVVKACILDIIEAIDKKGEGWENRTMDIVSSLLLHINSNYGEKGFEINDNDVFPDSVMRKIDLYIKEHMHEKISQDKLSDIAGLKSSQFNKRFKITTGYAPTVYMNIKRCAEAREILLTTDFDMNEVTAMCGYNDKSYFYKWYRKIYGTNAYEDAKGPIVETFYNLKKKP